MDLDDPRAGLPDEWTTDAAMGRAFRAYAAAVDDFRMPAACGVTRTDGDAVTLGHTRPMGAARALPAAVLAYVAGWDGTTATIPLTRASLADLVDRLDPSDAATHVTHAELRSWRDLLDGGRAGSRFAAHFLVRPGDRLADPAGAAFVQAAALAAAAGA